MSGGSNDDDDDLPLLLGLFHMRSDVLLLGLSWSSGPGSAEEEEKGGCNSRHDVAMTRQITIERPLVAVFLGEIIFSRFL
jgi:hypothetical protein